MTFLAWAAERYERWGSNPSRGAFPGAHYRKGAVRRDGTVIFQVSWDRFRPFCHERLLYLEILAIATRAISGLRRRCE